MHNTHLILFTICLFLGALLFLPRSVKSIILLNLLQSSVVLLFTIFSFEINNHSPFYVARKNIMYADPLVQAMMLTAIVVGFATTALGLALVIKINKLNSKMIDHKTDL